MLQDDRAANPQSAGGDEPVPSAIERVQRELAETRSALQGETTQISQLQQTLEEALRVARGVRLDALTELDRLAGELMDAARRDAETIRAQAEAEAQAIRQRGEQDVQALRAQAEADFRAQREATEANAAAKRAEIDRRVRAAQAEIERIQNAWSSTAQALTDARRNLTADLPDLLGGPEPTPGAPPPSPPEPAAPSASEREVASGESAGPFRASAAAVPGWGSGPAVEATPPGAEAPVWDTPPPEPVREAMTPVEPPIEEPEPLDVTRFDLAPSPLAEAADAEGPSETPLPRQETTEELGPSAAAAPSPADESAHAELFEGPSGSPLEQAGQQLRGGDVSAALDTYRGIVDRSPDEVEGVISRLTILLHDAHYRAHHEEVRLLLVDAYMVQGDYDRAMSLLHEPAS